MTEFVGFPKIARYSREVIVTEKIDGTNATLYIGEDGEFLVGSKTRWITPEQDNYGFAAWAQERKAELVATLGPGWHRGEWWDSGIQRGYGLAKDDKRLSLFNVDRWRDRPLPIGIFTVPVLWRGRFDALDVDMILSVLAQYGSLAAPGFMRPEGIVIHHVASNVSFKKTLERDDEPKGKQKEEKP